MTAKDGPTGPKTAPKIAPRRPKTATRRLKTAPRRPQDAPRQPKRPPRRPKRPPTRRKKEPKKSLNSISDFIFDFGTVWGRFGVDSEAILGRFWVDVGLDVGIDLGSVCGVHPRQPKRAPGRPRTARRRPQDGFKTAPRQTCEAERSTRICSTSVSPPEGVSESRLLT